MEFNSGFKGLKCTRGTNWVGGWGSPVTNLNIMSRRTKITPECPVEVWWWSQWPMLSLCLVTEKYISLKEATLRKWWYIWLPPSKLMRLFASARGNNLPEWGRNYVMHFPPLLTNKTNHSPFINQTYSENE